MNSGDNARTERPESRYLENPDKHPERGKAVVLWKDLRCSKFLYLI